MIMRLILNKYFKKLQILLLIIFYDNLFLLLFNFSPSNDETTI